MNDAGSPFSTDAAEIVYVVQQRIDERARRMTGRRVNDHPRRLVDDDEIAILKEDRQRQRLGAGLRIDWFGHVDGDVLPGFHRLIGFRATSIDADVTVPDKTLDVRSRVPGEHRDQKDIEPGARTVVGHREAAAHAAFWVRRAPERTGPPAQRPR